MKWAYETLRAYILGQLSIKVVEACAPRKFWSILVRGCSWKWILLGDFFPATKSDFSRRIQKILSPEKISDSSSMFRLRSAMSELDKHPRSGFSMEIVIFFDWPTVPTPQVLTIIISRYYNSSCLAGDFQISTWQTACVQAILQFNVFSF